MNNVTVKLIPVQKNGKELAENIYRRCGMCEKEQMVPAAQKSASERLCGNGKFFCNFCLRNGHYTRNNRHILMFSLRSIIGYYYHQAYLAKRMYLSELEDYIATHQRIGLLNPLFNYDPDTYLWFVDFSRVGNSKRKIKVEEVLKTVVNMFACFNLPQNIIDVKVSKFYSKVEEAIMNFHTKRHRPKNRRIMLPTLVGCIEDRNPALERYRNFVPKMMKSVDGILA
jgi:hypothetical protein